MKCYRYVGPPEIKERSANRLGTLITSAADLFRWRVAVSPEVLPDNTVPATFAIDAAGGVRIADRRSEHVACAGGGEVQSAGELFLHFNDEHVSVVAVTNQSTGYCPEPESWPAVAKAFESAGLTHPGRFRTEFVFRRCERCGQRNVVKEAVFECASCGGALPSVWNFDALECP